jgi:hypothetical protein
MHSQEFVLFLLTFLVFVRNSHQVTELTAFSEYSRLPVCPQQVIAADLSVLLCSQGSCICSNQADATSIASHYVSLICGTNAISNAVACITDFCAQINNPAPTEATPVTAQQLGPQPTQTANVAQGMFYIKAYLISSNAKWRAWR